MAPRLTLASAVILLVAAAAWLGWPTRVERAPIELTGACVRARGLSIRLEPSGALRFALLGGDAFTSSPSVVRRGDVTVGTEPEASPTERGARIARAFVDERLECVAGALEHSWRFAGPPGGRGPLEVSFRVDGARAFAPGPDELLLSTATHAVRYGPASWVDALGRRTAIPIAVTDGRVRMEVPEHVLSDTAWPATLDPSISPELRFGPTAPVSAQGPFGVGGNAQEWLVAWIDRRQSEEVRMSTVSAAGVPSTPDGVVLGPSDGTLVQVAVMDAGFAVGWRRDRTLNISYVAPGGQVTNTVGYALVDAGIGHFGLAASAAGILAPFTASTGSSGPLPGGGVDFGVLSVPTGAAQGAITWLDAGMSASAVFVTRPRGATALTVAQGASPGLYTLFTVETDWSGALVGPPLPIATVPSLGGQGYSSADLDTQAEPPLVAWAEDLSDGGRWIQVARLSDAGWQPVLASPFPWTGTSRPSVRLARDHGTPLVAWGDSSGQRAVALATNGVPLSVPFPMAAGQIRTGIAALGTGPSQDVLALAKGLGPDGYHVHRVSNFALTTSPGTGLGVRQSGQDLALSVPLGGSAAVGPDQGVVLYSARDYEQPVAVVARFTLEPSLIDPQGAPLPPDAGSEPFDLVLGYPSVAAGDGHFVVTARSAVRNLNVLFVPGDAGALGPLSEVPVGGVSPAIYVSAWNGGQYLAAWTDFLDGFRIHFSRITATGAVLDVPALDLQLTGVPAAAVPLGQGFAVATSSQFTRVSAMGIVLDPGGIALPAAATTAYSGFASNGAQVLALGTCGSSGFALCGTQFDALGALSWNGAQLWVAPDAGSWQLDGLAWTGGAWHALLTEGTTSPVHSLLRISPDGGVALEPLSFPGANATSDVAFRSGGGNRAVVLDEVYDPTPGVTAQRLRARVIALVGLGDRCAVDADCGVGVCTRGVCTLPGDAGTTDAGSDGGSLDAGQGDAGTTDAGSPDAGGADAGPLDAGTGDAGAVDAGAVDAGTADAGASERDAGVSPATYSVGCGCEPASADPGLLGVLAALVATRRRRRATSGGPRSS